MSTDAWNPQQYDQFKKERSQPFFDLLSLLHSHPHTQIIDLGCGAGELTAVLHQQIKAKSTLGIDSSEEMLKKAKSIATPTLSFAQYNIETWSPASTFDIVFAHASLQWCSNHPQLFQKLKTMLSPGGQLAIQMPMNHDYPTHVLANQMSFEEPWATLLGENKYEKQILTPEEYAILLFKLGFQEQKVLLRVYGHVLDSREGVIEWVKGTLLTHFQSRLTENQYQKFLTEFKARLFEQLPDEKPFFYPFKRILIWGKI